MPRHSQVAARLTSAEYQVLEGWLSAQEQPDPDIKLTIADALRQAIRDMAAAQHNRQNDRTRRR